MSAFAKLRAFTGTGPAGRVKKFTDSLAASDARLEQRIDALAEVAAAFVESADAPALQAAEAAVAAEQATRAALVRGLEAARKDLADEQAAEAARAEAERQASFLKQAEALDVEMRETFGRVIELAERSVATCGQIANGRGARFALENVMSEVAGQRARGAENVLFVRPSGFSLRLPPPSPKLAAIAAEAREIQMAQQKNVADFLAADAARAKEAMASQPEFGYQSAADLARRMP